MSQTPNNFTTAFEERFAQLPKVVQDAITSSDIEKNLRALAEGKSLHLDQWQTLENEVMLAVLGFQPVNQLEKNLQDSLGVTAEVAHGLALGINDIVFEPIRQELERQLQHPEAKAVVQNTTEEERSRILGEEKAKAAPTPPAAAPTATVARAPSSGDYKPGIASTARASVVDDPYREPPA